MEIREVKDTDSAQIVEIYNYYVESTSISFEEEPISVEVMQQRIEEVLSLGLPWLVAEVDGQILGYAYANRWKPRSAYRFTVEPSIYVKQGITSKGIGSTLYSHLLDNLKEKQIKNVIGVITLPNESSIRLHERLGFKKVGEFPNIGLKFGEKKSVGYWQLELNA
ncbi:GNAT family N-acetyltransferase [Vibrio owensii]|uniref:GNAT family N-acetyltransferase n=1 Tax=Vibrio owensii TaxID=696485 RepID=UPI00148C2112|nr:GNAT family N-acetyltransferase [Vibrio owensii]NOI71814.1 N-acetyltransferase family protein [Vibrio owensii]